METIADTVAAFIFHRPLCVLDIRPDQTSVGVASLRHVPVVTAFARVSVNTGSSSQSVPHVPPGCSADTSIAHPIGAVDGVALAETALRFQGSPAVSTIERCNAHLTLYVVSVRGQRPLSTRFHRAAEGSSTAARCTIPASKGPTAAFVAGAAEFVDCARAPGPNPSRLTRRNAR